MAVPDNFTYTLATSLVVGHSTCCIVQTEQEWATKLKKIENDRDKALAAKDALLQQAMQRAQAEAQAALDRLRSDSTAESKRQSAQHEQEMTTLKVTTVATM